MKLSIAALIFVNILMYSSSKIACLDAVEVVVMRGEEVGNKEIVSTVRIVVVAAVEVVEGSVLEFFDGIMFV